MKLKRHFPKPKPSTMCDSDGEYYEGVCEICEETTQILDNCRTGTKICDDCFDENYGRCSSCGDKYTPNEDLEEHDGWCYCCWEHRGRCEDCMNICEKEELDEHGFCEDCRVETTEDEEKKLLDIARQDKELRERVVCNVIKLLGGNKPKSSKPRIKCCKCRTKIKEDATRVFTKKGWMCRFCM